MRDILYMASLLSRVLAHTRQWHRTEQIRSNIHPAVCDMLAKYEPCDWHCLVLEWPHVSRSDSLRLAYTRSNEHGEIDRRTVTSIGKYLTRHFPHAPSDIIRDLTARYGAGSYAITHDMDEMQGAVHTGPESCMTKFTVGATHPYSVYDPALGWGMALRKDGRGVVTGRALVWEDPTGALPKRFVRTYSTHTNSNGYSQADDGLKNWLVAQGYSLERSWEGACVRYIKHYRYTDRVLLPYIDGGCQTLAHERYDNTLYFTEDNAEYDAANTDGTGTPIEDMACCDHCGDDTHEDDMHAVGFDDDDRICEHCLNEYYVYATGRRGRQYYTHQDNTVYVESCCEYYHERYLDDNGIIQLDCGDYEHRDNAVWLSGREIWLHQEDDDVIYCEHSSEYEHIDDCVQLADGNWALESDAWQCEHSDEWYLCDDVSSVTTPCGKIVHPDHLENYEQIGSV